VPITGIPLPFVSYGGTFLLMSWVALAVAARVAWER
jgi:rod shape determining protein RodA